MCYCWVVWAVHSKLQTVRKCCVMPSTPRAIAILNKNLGESFTILPGNLVDSLFLSSIGVITQSKTSFLLFPLYKNWYVGGFATCPHHGQMEVEAQPQCFLSTWFCFQPKRSAEISGSWGERKKKNKKLFSKSVLREVHLLSSGTYKNRCLG